MAYTLNMSFDFGSLTGLTLNGKLYDAVGVQVGATITTGFVEIGNGVYTYLATIPAAHVGSFVSYKSADATIKAVLSINPQEVETARSNIVKVNDVTVGGVGTALNPWGPA